MIKSVGAGGALLLSLAAAAQAIQDLRTKESLVQSRSTFRPTWSERNSFLEIFVGRQRQDYQEFDTTGAASNGILNTETGVQRHMGVAYRLQTSKGWLFHLQAQRQSGVTDYDGYLRQANGSLTPFRSTTGNFASQFVANIGYAIHAQTWSKVPENWQLAPLMQLGWHRWDRELEQYSEKYDFTSHSVGALVQWHILPRTLFEAQALVGRTRPSRVRVSALGFDAKQPGSNIRDLQFSISHDLTTIASESAVCWSVSARYTLSQSEHRASSVVNGLQAPPNQHSSRNWTFSLRRTF